MTRAAGAAPPVLGWVAVTNHVSAQALLLFLIIFAWTPPHFWALAIARRHDYSRADIPMLPVTHGVEFTRLHVLLYTVILCIVTLLPYERVRYVFVSGNRRIQQDEIQRRITIRPGRPLPPAADFREGSGR